MTPLYSRYARKNIPLVGDLPAFLLVFLFYLGGAFRIIAWRMDWNTNRRPMGAPAKHDISLYNHEIEY